MNSMVFDADSHVTEPMDIWPKYIEAKHRDFAPRLITDDDGLERIVIGGKVIAPGPFGLGGVATPGGLTDAVAAKGRTFGKAYPGGWDVAQRIKDMDAEGIYSSMMFTSVGLFFGGDEDPKLMAVLCRAYNDWVSDYCAQAPKRLFAAAMVPLMDIEASIEEARRAVKEKNLRAIMIRPNPYRGRSLEDRLYDPFWAALQDLDVAVCIHEGATGNIPFAGSERCANFGERHAVCHPHEQQIAMMQLICSGVLERFPKLRVAFLEANCGWLPYWIDRLDSHFKSLPHQMPNIARPPSEYFARQCWMSTEGDERLLPETLRLIGSDRFVWSSDYPHFDAHFPGLLHELDEIDLSAEARGKLLWENGMQLYKL